MLGSQAMLKRGVIATVALAGVGLVAWLAVPRLDELWRDWRALSPLTEDEAARLDACEDPGWTGLAKVLEQDLRTPCSEVWFAEQVVAHLARREETRSRRLKRTAWDRQRPPRARVRAGLSLAFLGREPPPDLSILTATMDRGEERTRLVLALAQRDWPLSWADPALSSMVAIARARDVDFVPDLFADLLSAAAAHRDPLADGRRSQLVELVLDELGIPLHGLRDPRSRAALEFVRGPLLGLEVCSDPGAPSCALALAREMEERPAPEDAPVTSPIVSTFLRAQAGADDPRVRNAERYLTLWVDWLLRVPKERRAKRLEAMLTSGTRSGSDGPVSVEQFLSDHWGPPWMTALLAMEFGRDVEIEVVVQRTDAGAVSLKIGGEPPLWSGCDGGGTLAHHLVDVSPEEVLVRALSETAGVAEPMESRRLLSWASRLAAEFASVDQPDLQGVPSVGALPSGGAKRGIASMLMGERRRCDGAGWAKAP
jgi:hypothetical protein